MLRGSILRYAALFKFEIPPNQLFVCQIVHYVADPFAIPLDLFNSLSYLEQ